MLLAVETGESGAETILVETPRRGSVPTPGDRVVMSFSPEDCVFVRE
jgi:hypothetical protein